MHFFLGSYSSSFLFSTSGLCNAPLWSSIRQWGSMDDSCHEYLQQNMDDSCCMNICSRTSLSCQKLDNRALFDEKVTWTSPLSHKHGQPITCCASVHYEYK
ncbi:hypothetical protein PoB_003493100 [Plakobranchus ocellatus]|uniref:Secreted protein n=1 Tax=Plakobranchus ocellatus TaxID=259542 RepID=A0AAV4ABA1_9GAST|nr:hypothetical protein PoB_003493100 [Plakobranchus ocellatus]